MLGGLLNGVEESRIEENRVSTSSHNPVGTARTELTIYGVKKVFRIMRLIEYDQSKFGRARPTRNQSTVLHLLAGF